MGKAATSQRIAQFVDSSSGPVDLVDCCQADRPGSNCSGNGGAQQFEREAERVRRTGDADQAGHTVEAQIRVTDACAGDVQESHFEGCREIFGKKPLHTRSALQVKLECVLRSGGPIPVAVIPAPPSTNGTQRVPVTK